MKQINVTVRGLGVCSALILPRPNLNDYLEMLNRGRKKNRLKVSADYKWNKCQ